MGETRGSADAQGDQGGAFPVLAFAGGIGTVFLYPVAALSLHGLVTGGEGAGERLLIALAAQLMLWACIALFLRGLSRPSGLPGAVSAAAKAMLIAAGSACLLAIWLMRRPDWLILIPAILPWIAVILGLWVRLTRPYRQRLRLKGLFALALIALPLITAPAVEIGRRLSTASLEGEVLPA